jgi:transmembrane sensor
MNNGNPGNYKFEDLVTDETFINYCLRKNPDDTRFWQDWITAHPDKEILVEKAEYYVRNFSLSLPENEYQEEFAKIKISIEPSFGTAGYQSVIKFLDWKKPSKAAGNRRRTIIRWMVPVLVIVLAGGYFFAQRLSGSAPDQIENINNGTVPLVFTLPDGTVITLAPHSGLKYPRKFDLALRKVYLSGEASFHVTADSAHPFKVYQGDLVATVLGTVFNIRKERRDSIMVVELIKGKLKVEIMSGASTSVQSVILLPNERVVYTLYNQRLFKEKWQLEEDLLLRKDHLIFKKDDYNAIEKKIKASFGITLINHSDKKGWSFTGEFTNSTAGEIVAGICKIEGLTSEIVGDTILIR